MLRKQQRDLLLQRSYEQKQQNALSSFLSPKKYFLFYKQLFSTDLHIIL